MQIPVDDKPSGRELLGRFIKDKEYRKTVFTNFLKDESSPGTKIIDENKVSARRIAAVQAEVFNLALNLPTVDKKGRPNAEYTMQTHDAIINTLEDVKKLGLISDLSVEKSGKKSRLRLVKLAIGSVSVKNLLVSFTGKTNADLVLPRQDIADVKFTVNDGVKITRENISEMSKGNKTLARFIKYEKRGILRFEYDDDGNLRYILPTTRKEQLKIERDRTET